MTHETDWQRGRRLAEATSGLEPSPDFTERVMLSVELYGKPLDLSPVRGAMLVCFAAAASVAFLFFHFEQRQLDTGAFSVLDSIEQSQ